MIICADLHIRKDTPLCRKDDYLSTQDEKLRFLLSEAKKSPPLIIAGDLFDKARPGPWLERYTIELFKWFNVKPIVVAGQHDMPYHSQKHIDDSGLGVLRAADAICLLESEILSIGGTRLKSDLSIYGVSYDMEPEREIEINKQVTNILLWHHMVIKDDPLWPGQIADTGGKLLRIYSDYDLIVTGDNHNTFTVKKDNRWLINSGSMMRMDADQINHKPCVFKFEDNKLEQIFFPIKPFDKVISREHIEHKKEKDERISSLIEKLNSNYEIGLSFEKNLEQTFKLNKVDKEVKEIILTSLEKRR